MSHNPNEFNKEKYRELITQREYYAVKANDLIRSRYLLSAQEQKALNFIISKIKPDDDLFSTKEFNITEYCQACGIDYEGGANYKYIKSTLKGIADKSVYIPTEDGGELLIRWLNMVYINKNSGIVRYSFFEGIIPYLSQLKSNYTQFRLINTLAMKSQYSIRIYEILKSYESLEEYKVDLEELKILLYAVNYKRYPDFRRNVLDIAVDEINRYSDIIVNYIPITKGRKVERILFKINKKDFKSSIKTMATRHEVIGIRDKERFGEQLDGETIANLILGEEEKN